jgi:outer membrane receptor for ferric coprogen and ferric-rhodotorulic acid
VTKDISAYTSYSRSFAGVPQSSIDMYGNPLTKQVEGRGSDVGVKSSFWNDRINLNAAAFMIDQINVVRQVSTNEIIAAGLDPVVVTGARSKQDQSARAKGWEMDVTIKAFEGYQMAATYTNLHAFVTANLSNPAAVGRGPSAQGPGRESWSLFHKYEFPRKFLGGLTLTQSFVFRDSRRPRRRASPARTWVRRTARPSCGSGSPSASASRT